MAVEGAACRCTSFRASGSLAPLKGLRVRLARSASNAFPGFRKPGSIEGCAAVPVAPAGSSCFRASGSLAPLKEHSPGVDRPDHVSFRASGSLAPLKVPFVSMQPQPSHMFPGFRKPGSIEGTCCPAATPATGRLFPGFRKPGSIEVDHGFVRLVDHMGFRASGSLAPLKCHPVRRGASSRSHGFRASGSLAPLKYDAIGELADFRLKRFPGFRKPGSIEVFRSSF